MSTGERYILILKVFKYQSRAQQNLLFWFQVQYVNFSVKLINKEFYYRLSVSCYSYILKERF